MQGSSATSTTYSDTLSDEATTASTSALCKSTSTVKPQVTVSRNEHVQSSILQSMIKIECDLNSFCFLQDINVDCEDKKDFK